MSEESITIELLQGKEDAVLKEIFSSVLAEIRDEVSRSWVYSHLYFLNWKDPKKQSILTSPHLYVKCFKMVNEMV